MATAPKVAANATDRVLLWGVTGFQKRSRLTPRSTQELRDSLLSASLWSRGAAFVVLHDGRVSCAAFKNESAKQALLPEWMPCLALPPSIGSTSHASCQLGTRQLVDGRMYLIEVNATAHHLDLTPQEWFSYRNRTQPAALWDKSRPKTACGDGNRTTCTRKAWYGAALGLGTWYRYVADRILLPLGVRQALYLDGDTCVLRDLMPMFTLNDTAALVVARRESSAASQFDHYKAMGFNFGTAKKVFGFPGFAKHGALVNALAFNAGVLLINLASYCEQDVWGAMMRMAHRHATKQRMFGPLNEINDFSDNDLLFVVGAAKAHYVGPEWNCRLAAAYNDRKLSSGTYCRIRHLHETEINGQRVKWITGYFNEWQKHRCSSLMQKTDKQARGPRLKATRTRSPVGRRLAVKPAKAPATLLDDAEIECSFLVHTYSNRKQAEPMVAALHAVPARSQLLVSVDRADVVAEAAAWVAAIYNHSRASINDAVVVTGNVHEIRAYWRLASLARGRLLVFLQGDYRVPAAHCWWTHARRLFEKFPRLAVLGGYNGQRNPALMTKEVWGRARYAHPIDFALDDADGGNHTHVGPVPVRFVQIVNIGPLFVLRHVFQRLGGFHEWLSQPGEPGPGLDWELSLRAWEIGWQVAIYYSGFENGVGGRHTISDPKQNALRKKNERANFVAITKQGWRVRGKVNLTARISQLNQQLRPLDPTTAQRLKQQSRTRGCPTI